MIVLNKRQSNFPFNEATALAMLYLEKQDLKGLSPTQLAEKYLQVYKEIEKYLDDKY